MMITHSQYKQKTVIKYLKYNVTLQNCPRSDFCIQQKV